MPSYLAKHNDDFTGTNGDPIDSGKWYTSGFDADSMELEIQSNRYFHWCNTQADSLWYNGDEGCGIWQLADAPFDFIAYNIGIGESTDPLTTWDSQSEPVPGESPWGNSPYMFAGVCVHVADNSQSPEDALDGTDVNYIHSVVGHRGGTYRTVENKNTSGGSSNQVDEGYNACVDISRADIRVIATDDSGDLTVTFYWREATTGQDQTPGDLEDWTESNHTAFSIPTYTGSRAWVGIYTYLYDDYQSVPTLGTCDKVEWVDLQELTPGALDLSPTFHSPTISGLQDLSPGLFSAAPTLHVPVVTPGAVDVSPDADLDLAPQLYVPVVTSVYYLLAGLSDYSPSYPAGTVTPGAVDLTPSLATFTAALHVPVLSVPPSAALQAMSRGYLTTITTRSQLLTASTYSQTIMSPCSGQAEITDYSSGLSVLHRESRTALSPYASFVLMSKNVMKVGDRLPKLECILTDQDGAVVDLTGATVQIQLSKSDGTVVTTDATIVSATAGTVEYSWGANDTNTAGAMTVEFIVTSGGLERTFPSTGTNVIQVNARLD